ncbi:glycosyltransferase family 4 protein [Noviherbaspirillum aerium]|uniref:glycosyltransferase family 4 protein n=1 Tax=Noviherbaspirillum aerium TaxID=2588497 RepID=UPI00124D67C0|nr:glycosyltransferase family 1 protein [Noviherbaspirillum aerium]
MDALKGVRVGINAVPLLGPLTGVGQYTYRLISEMQHLLDPQPWLFYGTDWGQDLRTAAPPAARRINDAIKRFVPNPLVLTRMLKQLRFSSGAREHGITLYHEPAYLALRYRGPTVVTVHDISWIRYPETHPAERVREMNRVMPSVLRRADHIVVDSEFVRQEVIDHYGLAAERVSTILLGVAPEFRPMNASGAVLSQYGLRYGQYILAVGTLEPRKNLLSVIAAFSRLPDGVRWQMPLVIVGMDGWGMEKFSTGLQQMIARGEVVLTGYVAQAELPALYSGARMFVYPSIYEGFGLPPLEAMACGTPVIASNRASLPEVVGDAGLLVEPLDDDAIRRHMQELLENDELHARLAQAGRERAASFTWRRFALQTLDVYRKVLT